MSKKDIDTTALQAPPCSLEFESGIIGAILADYTLFEKVNEYLKSEYFYNEIHQKIYETATELYDDAKPVELLTIKERLASKGLLEQMGGFPFLIGLVQSKMSHSLQYACEIIYTRYVQRNLIRVGMELQMSARDDTKGIDEILSQAEKCLYDATDMSVDSDALSMSACYKALEDEMAESVANGGVAGVHSGYDAIDRITNGWQNGQVIIIAGRPAMGKTAFVISMADRIAYKVDKKIAVFSLEMSAPELLRRIIVSRTGLEMQKIENGVLTDNDRLAFLKAKSELTSRNNLYIDDTPGMSIATLRSKARKMKKKHKIDIIVIDYLQLLSGGGKYPNRQEEVAYISRQLKALAKELKIPIIALAQINRATENRPDKTPQLSDLRESGAIEQDADVIGFLHRPEYYGTTTDKEGKPYEPGTALLMIKKNRRGALADIALHFEPRLVRFDDLNQEPQWVSARVDTRKGWAEEHGISIVASVPDTPPMPDMNNNNQLPF